MRGRGVNFHGAITERIADGTTRSSLVITVGADREARCPCSSRPGTNSWLPSGRATTLVVALSGANLPVPSAGTPQTYEFSGVYNGQVRTIMRVPAAEDSRRLTPGRAKGSSLERTGGSFYCAPLLVSATAELGIRSW